MYAAANCMIIYCSMRRNILISNSAVFRLCKCRQLSCTQWNIKLQLKQNKVRNVSKLDWVSARFCVFCVVFKRVLIYNLVTTVFVPRSTGIVATPRIDGSYCKHVVYAFHLNFLFLFLLYILDFSLNVMRYVRQYMAIETVEGLFQFNLTCEMTRNVTR